MLFMKSHGGTRLALSAALVAGSIVVATLPRALAAPASYVSAMTVANATSGQLVASSPLTLSGTTVTAGGQINAAVTLQNQGSISVVVNGFVFATRTPSGGDADFGGMWTTTTLAAGQSLSLQGSRVFSASDPLGIWTINPSYRTSDNVWHNLTPALPLTMSAPVPTATATKPAPTATIPAPTATVPAPTATIPAPTATVPAASALLASPALSLSATTVSAGGQVNAAVTLRNQGSTSVVLNGFVFATRTSSGGDADFGGTWTTTTLAAGQSLVLQGSRVFSASDPLGAWTIYPSYRTSDNVWHNLAPTLSLTVSAPAPTATATVPAPTATATVPAPTATKPAPTATATIPAPTATATIPAPTATLPAPTATTVPSTGGAIALGATIHDDNAWVGPGTGLLETYAGMVGRMPAIVNAGGGSALNVSFDSNLGNYLLGKGAAFMWTMMPSRTDAQVVSGTYDSYLTTFAQAVKAWGHPLYLRFAHEANGNWYPYGTEGSPSGNSPAQYVAMWKHVHNIFTSVGATNVRWIWCMNVDSSGMTPFSQLYPGDAYVDWIALDGYNWGGNPGHTWQSFSSVFSTSYQEITALTSKPLIITETSSAEEGGSKASWITQGLLTTVPQSFPRLKALMWFDWTMEHDWRVNSSTTSLAAFQSVVASPEYQASMP